MGESTPVGDFLRARREALKPQDVGLPEYGRRRVPGLRREEVAMLAGVSSDYIHAPGTGPGDQPVVIHIHAPA